MIRLLCFVLAVLASPFKSKSRLEAENAALRHQLIVLRRKLHGRVRLTNNDRWFFIQLYRWSPSILQVLTIIRPETLMRWHRAGFRRYWRWKSCPRGGRPQIDTELRALIRRMSIENSLWGAPRIHGELLKLGFELAQSSVAKYMVKRRWPPSPGWRTFLRNHAPDIAAMDLFVVPTIGFDLLYAFVIVRLDRRDLVWINVTRNPTAEWVARQITEAFPWDEAPKYLIRDRDRIYGTIVTRRLRAMGIRDKPTAPASPWQNGFAERLIGSIRRECLDHIVVFGETHLRRILRSYARYYNDIRTHRSLDKDAPVARLVQRTVLVQDNLNIHSKASLYEAFPAAEARRLVERFEWHYTPKHGSWLDLAESELGVLSSQCLDRRIPDKQTLIEEIAAWENDRNANHTKANWHFTTPNARIKLKHLYPSI